MVALPGAPDHRRIDRTRRSRSKGVNMLTTTVKRMIATTLSGAAIAGAIGAPGASAMPIDPVRAPGEPSDVPIVPSSRSSAPAAVETPPDAGFDLSSAAIGAAADPANSSAAREDPCLLARAGRKPSARSRGNERAALSVQASATDESWQPAISRYDDLEANKAKSMQALGLAMMQQSFASPYRDVEANKARTAQAR
jgi:hypothetical protein